MWELSKEQLEEIGRTLDIPADLNVEYTQDEACYWDAGGCYTTYVQILLNEDVIASAMVDSFTGELIRNTWTDSDSNIQNEVDDPIQQLIGKWSCDEGSISFSGSGTCYFKMNGRTIGEGGTFSVADEDTLIINEPGMLPYEVDFQFVGEELILGGITFIRE